MRKMLPFCSENSSPFQLYHAHMTNGTRLSTAQLQCSGTGTGETGNETKNLLHKFRIEFCEGLGMRLCHVPCYLSLIHHRGEGCPQPVLWADTPLPVLQEIHPVQNYTIHKQ